MQYSRFKSTIFWGWLIIGVLLHSIAIGQTTNLLVDSEKDFPGEEVPGTLRWAWSEVARGGGANFQITFNIGIPDPVVRLEAPLPRLSVQDFAINGLNQGTKVIIEAAYIAEEPIFQIRGKGIIIENLGLIKGNIGITTAGSDITLRQLECFALREQGIAVNFSDAVFLYDNVIVQTPKGILLNRSGAELAGNQISGAEEAITILDDPNRCIKIIDDNFPNYLFGNKLGISIRGYQTGTWNSCISISGNYLGFSPDSAPLLLTGQLINPAEANDVDIHIAGLISGTTINSNWFRYHNEGIVIDSSAANNLGGNEAFYKIPQVANTEHIPIQLNLNSGLPANTGKAAPVMQNVAYDAAAQEVSISGDGEPDDVIHLYRSDEYGNIRALIGLVNADAQGNWQWAASINTPSVFDPCSENYYAAIATDNAGNTSQFAYTNALAIIRVIEPQLTVADCSGLDVVFSDNSRNAQPGDAYVLAISGELASTTRTGVLPLSETVALPAGEYQLTYTLGTGPGACQFTTIQSISVSPDYQPQIDTTYPYANNTLEAVYTGPALNNINPGFDYRWIYRRIIAGSVVEIDTIGKLGIPSSTEIDPLLINVQPGKYELYLEMGNDLSDPFSACRAQSNILVPIIPPRGQLTATPANCGNNGNISIVMISGRPPFLYQINGGDFQTEGSFSGLSPGDYRLVVEDADLRRPDYTLNTTMRIPDQNPDIQWRIGGGFCDTSPAAVVSIETTVTSADPALSGTYDFEVFNPATQLVLFTGTGNYSTTQQFSVPGASAGDPLQLRLLGPDCDLETPARVVPAPDLEIILDQPDGRYPSCGSDLPNVGLRIELSLPALTPAPTDTTFVLQLQRRSESSRRFENEGALVTTSDANYTFPDLPVGEYRIEVAFRPDTYNCRQEITFQVLPPSALTAGDPEVTDVSCAGFDNGQASIIVDDASGPVNYRWSATTSPDQIISYGPVVKNLAAGNYQMEVWDSRSCVQDRLLRTFTINAPTPLEDITVAQNTDQCGLTANMPAGKGSPPYRFSWRNEDEQEVALEEDLVAEGGVVTSTPDFTGIPPGIYRVYVTDANGCTAVSPDAELVQPPLDRTYDICFRWVAPGIPAIPLDTIPPTVIRFDEMADRARLAIQDQEIDCVLAQQASLDAYTDRCFDPAFLADTLSLAYELYEHHYTLFYYDRAGNLVQTVPPAGVDDSNQSRGEVPDHEYRTRYTYNSLGQLTQQATPDGGTTRYLYNDLTQLRFSQNARQADPGDPDNLETGGSRFSYSKYDRLGRVVEVGEHLLEPGENFADLNDPDLLQTDPNFPASEASRDVTRTVYNDPMPDLTYLDLPNRPQRYLDNRISYAWRANQNGDTVTTYYSYDPHGNVEWLVQELPEIGRNYIGYKYDLISGNVLGVDYNRGYIDQFFHRYQYDEENRLTQVETSRDGYLWDRDARYVYYPHGPLKSMLLGEDHIQKVDYTYTIHGWLKAINTPNLDDNEDEGPTPDKTFPQDAFGMVLGYYPGDFKHTGSLLDASQDYSLSNFSTGHALYNGNIAAWSSRIGFTNPEDPFSNQLTANRYAYDRLNRLRASRFHEYTGPGANPYAALPDLATDYTYDGNGNFLTLDRKGLTIFGEERLPMDAFTYDYYPETNRLNRVTDAVAHPADEDPYELDIKPGQLDSNYVYDASGNLIEDRQEGLQFRWDSHGKLLEIKPFYKTNSSNQKPSLKMVYGPFGHRVLKKVNFTPYDVLGNPLEDLGKITTSYYQRDAVGQILNIYRRSNRSDGIDIFSAFFVDEQTIPGMRRLGVLRPDSLLIGKIHFSTNEQVPLPIRNLTNSERSFFHVLPRTVGKKSYELADHLTSVKAIFSDQKRLRQDLPNPSLLREYNNYFPYGMLQSFRSGSSGMYKFGFNGQEKDDEISGRGNSYTALYWQYDSRVGRRLNLDPKFNHSVSPYATFATNPIRFFDILGDTIYQFRPDGDFIGFVDDGKEEVTGRYFQTHTPVRDNAGNVVSWKLGDEINFRFNDLELDRADLINNQLEFRVHSEANIKGKIVLSGALTPAAQSAPWAFIERESRPTGNESLLSRTSSGSMDFVNTPSVEYFTINIVLPGTHPMAGDEAVGYNAYDFGNFLWGHAGKHLGFSLFTLTKAAHLNNAVNGRTDNYKQKIGILDDPGDQRAIIRGFHYPSNPFQYLRSYRPSGPNPSVSVLCFAKGTLISMVESGSKPIEKIETGEVIYSWNSSKKQIEQDTVVRVDSVYHNNMVSIIFSDSTKNINTSDHPYYIKGKGWCAVDNSLAAKNYNLQVSKLSPGDIAYKLWNGKLQEIEVLSIIKVKQNLMTYNISELKRNSSYFANGILVHNESGSPWR